MTTTVENLKSEISDCYLNDLKKELWWFKSIAILPIKKPIKDILMWKKELPEKFDEVKEFWWWKNIIWFVSPKVANQIFEFMKEKRFEIERRKTEAELTELKNNILWLESPTLPESWNNDESNNADWWDSSWWTSEEWNEEVSLQEQEQQEQEEWNENIEEKNENSDWNESSESWIDGRVAWGLVWAWWVSMWAWLAIWERSQKAAEMKALEWFSSEKIKWTIDTAIESMENQVKALWPDRLTSRQVKTINKHIEKLREWQKAFDKEGIDALTELNKLWDKLNFLPRQLLENCWLTAKQLWKIDDLAEWLVWKSASEIRAILHSNWVTSIDESIVKALSKADNVSDIKSMTKVLSCWKKVNRIAQTVAGALWIDVAFLGLDVWMYIESDKEAELISKINKLRWENKHNQAVCQLLIWISSVVIELIAIIWVCAAWWSMWWPWGTVIWLAVWVITAAVSMAVDPLYYDVKDFYLQNQEDFLREKRSQLKQAILQWIHNKKQWDTSINELITSYYSPSLKPWSELKEKNLSDACVSMIILEEVDRDWMFEYDQYLVEYIQSWESMEDFLSKKPEEYKKEFKEIWDELQKRVDKRVKYINSKFEDGKIIEQIKWCNWMQYLTQLFTESKWYADLIDKWNRDENKTFELNLQEYKSELFKEFPKEKIEKLENIKKDNPSLFLEIMTTVTWSAFTSEDEENEDYTQNVRLITKYQEWLRLTENIEDKRYLNVPNPTHFSGRFIEKLIEADFELDAVEYPSITQEAIINRMQFWEERRWLTDVSDNVLQNVLYKLARELYWYSWDNDIQSLMWFFSESNGDNHWIYYSDKRKVNDDWAIDTALTNNLPQTLHENDVDKYVDYFMTSNFLGRCNIWSYVFLGPITATVLNATSTKSSIDTPTESIDDELNVEFRNKLRSLIKEELLNHTVENKEKVKNEILEFVKKHSKDWNYIELPYFLILEAKKAGLWDLQRQFFKRDNDKLEICYLHWEINQTAIIDNCEKSYISPARESFTKSEHYYINRVESAIQKINKIREKQWFGFTRELHHEDDLDIPIEIEHIISDKTKEWNAFKQTILLYDSQRAANTEIYNKYEEYATYFENLYKWMLISLSWFCCSNDIDTNTYFSHATYYGSMDIFNENGEIDPKEWDEEPKELNNLLKDDKFQTFYNTQINELKIKGKSIKELRSSDDGDERAIAKEISNLIIVKTLETCLIKFTPEWNVSEIAIWWGRFDGDMSKRKDNKWKIAESLKKHISKIEDYLQMNWNNISKPVIDDEKIKEKIKGQEIKKLRKSQKETTDITPKIQKIIENALSDVDWSYKRWDIQYDPETSTLNSRGYNKTKIIFEEGEDWEFKSLKIEWLDIIFTDIQEWIRVANLINFMHYNAEKHPFKSMTTGRWPFNHEMHRYKWEDHSLMRDVNNSYDDVEIVRASTMKKDYAHIVDSPKFMSYINNFLM